jgi:hypothetical protein
MRRTDTAKLLAVMTATYSNLKFPDPELALDTWHRILEPDDAQDIMDAFDQTDVLCKSANIYMCARNMGSEPDGMTAEAMKEVQDVFNLPKKRPC